MFPEIVEDAKRDGFDGLVYASRDDLRKGETGWGDDFSQIVTFYPTQIKSATDNSGDFSLENPDIRYSIADRDNSLVGVTEETPEGNGQFRSGFYTPTEEYSIPRLLMPYLQEKPDAERFLLAARSALREDEARTAAARPSSSPARA